MNESSAVESDYQNLDNQPVTDFPPRGWGTRSQSFPSALNDFPSPFGTFLDDVTPPGWPDPGPPPPPHMSTGFHSFGRGGGVRGRGYLRQAGPLPPQEELSVGANTDLEYDVLPNGMILKDEYFTSMKTVTPRGNKKFTTKVKKETPWSLCLLITTNKSWLQFGLQ